MTDPSEYTSNNTSNHFEEMKRIKNTDYQDLSEQQLLTLFVENIKNVRYFTMMQLLDTEQFIVTFQVLKFQGFTHFSFVLMK